MYGKWPQFVARIRDIAGEILENNKGGVSKVTVHLFVNRDGDPLVWWVSERCRLEPSKDAQEILARVLGGKNG